MKFSLQNSHQILLQILRWLQSMLALLGGRNVVMLAGALIITIISVMFSDNWISAVGEQMAKTKEMRANIDNLHKLKLDVYKAESAQRGYLLTGRIIYIAPFENVLKDAHEKINAVTSFIVANPNFNHAKENEWLKSLSASLEAKATEMKLTISLVDSEKFDEAKQLVNLDEGMIAMNKFVNNADLLIKSQDEARDKMIEKRNNTLLLARISVLGSTFVLILLVVLVIKQLLKEIVTKNKLGLQVIEENTIYENKLREQTKLLRSLALDYQADVERERQRLSRELHDELGSIFTATKMDMAWVMKKLNIVSPNEISTNIIEKLKKTTRYIDQGIQYQRHIVQELHPAMLSTFGFWPALTSLITDAAERNQWQLTLELPDKNTKINETISLVAYRIVQETLNNANKYAKATEVSVFVMVDEKYLKVEIADNGVGVDMNALDGNTHGLSGMRHRVMAIGGHFELLSTPGTGVITHALIPLDISLL